MNEINFSNPIIYINFADYLEKRKNITTFILLQSIMVQSIKRGFAALVAIFAGVAAFAQVTTSSLAGNIKDETGEPLTGAAVVAVHTPSGTQYAAVANIDQVL